VTKWPLVCETCETEVYVGTLAGGECGDCHKETVVEQLAAADASASSSSTQSGLGDFA
jgi:hypothetical protein